MNIYVGNLSFDANEADLENAFAKYGDVNSVNIIKDRETGRSRGFGFVEMREQQDGQAAIDGVNLKEIAGRAVTVNEARPRTERSGGGGRRSQVGGGTRDQELLGDRWDQSRAPGPDSSRCAGSPQAGARNRRNPHPPGSAIRNFGRIVRDRQR